MIREFTIGEPVHDVPPPTYHGKYAEIWEAARLLGPNMFLPVVFPENRQARSFAYGSKGTARAHGYRLIRRGTTVYILREFPA